MCSGGNYNQGQLGPGGTLDTLVCSFCPKGIGINPDNTLTGFCNDGSSYVASYLTVKATMHRDQALHERISVTATGTLGVGSFDFFYTDFGLTEAKTAPAYKCGGDSNPPCHAILTGTFGVTVKF